MDEQLLIGPQPPAELVTAPQPAPSKRRQRLSKKVWFAFGFTGLLAAVLIGFLGFNAYLQIAEWLDPSGRVYVEVDGDKHYLEQPNAFATPNAPAGGAAPTAAEAAAAPKTPLPPLYIEIPALDIGAAVVVADNRNLPPTRLAGWFFGSAFPATDGNTVIIGHVNGEGAIFSRLSELQPGDEIRIRTDGWVHTYVVSEQQVVDQNAVEVLAPTPTAALTLITCAGEWNPADENYPQRLVVRAGYAAVAPSDEPLP